MTTLFNSIDQFERAMAAKTKTNVITALTTLPQRWVSARKHQCTTAITTMWAESSWAIPESCAARIMRSSDGDNGETKGLITPPSKWVSAQLLYVCVTAWWRSRRSSQNLCSPFLRAVRLFIYIIYIIYITRHNFSPTWSVIDYAAQFFPYQECNYLFTLHYAAQFSPTRSVITTVSTTTVKGLCLPN